MVDASALCGPVHIGRREAVLLPANYGNVDTIGGFGRFRTRIAHYGDEQANFSVVDFDLQPGEHLPPHTSDSNERVAICYAGSGRVIAAGVERTVAQGDVMFWGRGTCVALFQEGSEPMHLAIVSLVPSSENASKLFPTNRAALRLVDSLDANNAGNGGFLFDKEEDGEQYWQAAPSLGYITLKFGDSLPVDYFSASSQTLDADAAVRLHGHAVSTEIVVCTRGRGIAAVGENETIYAEGDLLILPPTVTHRFINDSGKPWTYTGIFTPPSVESALRETGVRKMPGTERPTAIPRNPTTERLLVEKYGFIIPSLQQ